MFWCSQRPPSSLTSTAAHSKGTNGLTFFSRQFSAHDQSARHPCHLSVKTALDFFQHCDWPRENARSTRCNHLLLPKKVLPSEKVLERPDYEKNGLPNLGCWEGAACRDAQDWGTRLRQCGRRWSRRLVGWLDAHRGFLERGSKV